MKFFVTSEDKSKTSYQLETHEKDIKNALRHLCDVISKKKFEVLPGNGTILLDLITGLHAVMQKIIMNENSTTFISATTKMYYSLGKLIKLCDEFLLNEDQNDCSSLNTENVTGVAEEVENAVQQLVQLATEKAKEKEKEKDEQKQMNNNTLKPTVVDIAAQRTSLPDIPLTPKERDILEKSSSNPMRVSQSTESILRDTSPPPKPPHPSRSSNPPPLPPKRRSQNSQNELHHYNSLCPAFDNISSGNNTIDHLSLRSRSPDDNSSLLSISAGSLDSASVFNNSKGEDGLHQNAGADLDMDDEYDKVFQINPKLDNSKRDILRNNRHSNESGIDSMQSIRASMQSVSTKRSSEQSIQYQKSTANSNSDISCTKRFESTKNFQEINDFHSTTTSSATLSQQNTFFTVSSGVIAHNNSIFEKQSSSSASTSLSVSKTNSVDLCDGIINMITEFEDKPPLPAKTNRIKGFMSQFDNFENKTDHVSCANDEFPELRNHMSPVHNWQSKHQSLMDSKTCNSLASFTSDNDENPPPLPLKRKQKASIIAYMEICSSSTRTTEQLRHSMHTFNISQSASENFSSRNQITHSQTMNLAPVTKSDLFSLEEDDKPPALPPKARHSQPPPRIPPPTIITTPPPSPKPTLCSDNYENRRIINSSIGNEMSTVNEEVNEYIDDDGGVGSGFGSNIITGIAGNTKDINNSSSNTNDYIGHSNAIDCSLEQMNDDEEDVVLRNPPCSPNIKEKGDDLNILEETDVAKYLIFKKEGEDGADVKGGYFDALLVHASQVSKGSEGAFAEAFITTFRTIIQPLEVIEKLTHRYTIFCSQVSDKKKKAAKETFSLLVRVVNDLTSQDLTGILRKLLVEFVYQLVLSGQLQMAKLLRSKIVEKVQANRFQQLFGSGFGELTRNIVTNQPTLLDLKSSDIAEQMTLLDADLFEKIEIPEVLLFAREQCEEKTPNLNKFTEHFNKMSFWARSQILKQNDAKDREKHVIKFIKIMKHLRKMNNYNSYLALLSALDSAPIRRLEWHKTITEGLKEYCALIDSSSSFRIYRHALAETSPPCIPYIGLVLQDLTFVHVGNPDYLREGVINFSKRWQQYNIIVNMKKFKKCTYPFRRNERIIGFFENFEDFLDEEQMWQISENIKPRGKRTTN
ncbi:RAPGEF1 family protein [Megaselia abdita]